jgi:hypothetical protein
MKYYSMVDIYSFYILVRLVRLCWIFNKLFPQFTYASYNLWPLIFIGVFAYYQYCQRRPFLTIMLISFSPKAKSYILIQFMTFLYNLFIQDIIFILSHLYLIDLFQRLKRYHRVEGKQRVPMCISYILYTYCRVEKKSKDEPKYDTF